MGQTSPVEVQHAQGMTELSGDLGSSAVVEMGYSIFQRLGTLSGLLVTKEGDHWCSEDVLYEIDEDPVLLKSVEESL
jgi:hypothetical protein